MKKVMFKTKDVELVINGYTHEENMEIISTLLFPLTTIQPKEVKMTKDEPVVYPEMDMPREQTRERLPNKSDKMRCPNCLQSKIALTDDNFLVVSKNGKLFASDVSNMVFEKDKTQTIEEAINGIIDGVVNIEIKCSLSDTDDILSCPICEESATNKRWIKAGIDYFGACEYCGGEVENLLIETPEGRINKYLCVNQCKVKEK